MFERLCALCNDVGLLSEEHDPKADRLLGNFPQAFSQVALLNTAANRAARTSLTAGKMRHPTWLAVQCLRTLPSMCPAWLSRSAGCDGEKSPKVRTFRRWHPYFL